MEETIEIPSEIIEPHVKNYMMIQLQSLHYGMITPEEIRSRLKGVESFICMSSGVHARLATSNEFYKINRLSDEAMIKLANDIYNEPIEPIS